MAAIVFPARSILYLDGTPVSEHGRSPLTVSYDVIENANRTVTGTMRKYIVAKKYNLSTSWNFLPNASAITVDGYAGGDFLNGVFAGQDSTAVQVWTSAAAAKNSSSPSISFTGYITNFSSEIVSRNVMGQFYDFCNVSLTIEEG